MHVTSAFLAAKEKREKERQLAEKDKAERLALARERRHQEREEIKSHKTAMIIAATREKETRVQRRQELDRCRSDAYEAEIAREAANKEHQRLMTRAAVEGENEARYERVLKSVRSVDREMAAVTEGKGSRKRRRRTVPDRPTDTPTSTTARRRCMKNSGMLRKERARMVSKACDALRVAKKKVRDAMDVPYPDQDTRQKINKGHEMILSALTELGALVEPPKE